jgi:chemotaxis protein CheD
VAAVLPESFVPSVHVLHPGDIACGCQGDLLETLLGSCVAVVLTDRARTFGAMCHIVHGRQSLLRDVHPTAAADPALDALYGLVARRGLTPRLCQAFVYGGGNMFPHIIASPNVGEENVRYVLSRLAADGVHVAVQDVCGTVYRRVRWQVGQGLPDVTAVAV